VAMTYGYGKLFQILKVATRKPCLPVVDSVTEGMTTRLV